MARLIVLMLLSGLFVLSDGLWAPVSAESVVTCHCFRDRQFSPDHPKAFDPYLLATVQNRLLGYVFSVPRKEIVKQKMGGQANSRLWVAYYVAEVSGRPVTEVLSTYATTNGWMATIRKYQIDPELLGSTFMSTLLQNGAEQSLAWVVVKTVLVDDFVSFAKQLGKTPGDDLELQEMILASILGSITGQTVAAVLSRRQLAGSWGALLADDEVSIAQLDEHFKRRVQIRR